MCGCSSQTKTQVQQHGQAAAAPSNWRLATSQVIGKPFNKTHPPSAQDAAMTAATKPAVGLWSSSKQDAASCVKRAHRQHSSAVAHPKTDSSLPASPQAVA